MPRNDLLVWMDLEMTSLTDVRVDQIIEIATIITDGDLQTIAEGPDIVIRSDASQFSKQAMEFHAPSGILEESFGSTISVSEAEDRVLAFLKEYAAPQTAPLCGNSIHADRAFLRVQMPRIHEYLFYRCIDVSTLKELARRWRPAVFEEAKRRKGDSVHRALGDIRASIEELKFYKDALFKN